MVCSRSEPVPRCCLVALSAIECTTENTVSTFGRCSPRPVRPWRIVAHMLVVPAFEFSDPMMLFVSMKADDSLVH